MTSVNFKTAHLLDRGLQYGDGVFETIAISKGQPWLLKEHLTRLHNSCITMGLYDASNITFINDLKDILNTECLGYPRHIVKVIITRGEGGRGYQAPRNTTLNCYINFHELPEYETATYREGADLTTCKTQVSTNPSLAGMKHLCRLENVLARSEFDTTQFADGIMLDHLNKVIECTMSNLFILKDGLWQTPKLDSSGVKGVMRGLLLDATKAEESALTLQNVLAADSVVICNSVMGVVPVKSITSNKQCHPLSIAEEASKITQLLNNPELHPV